MSCRRRHDGEKGEREKHRKKLSDSIGKKAKAAVAERQAEFAGKEAKAAAETDRGRDRDRQATREAQADFQIAAGTFFRLSFGQLGFWI